MSLTNLQVKNAKPKDRLYKLTDGNGLYLAVTTKGIKSWRYDYKFNGKRKTHTYGKSNNLSLADVRQKHLQLKKELEQGNAPDSVKSRLESHMGAEYKDTFGYFSKLWFDLKIVNKSKSHRTRSLRLLNKYLLPYLGHLDVAHIDMNLLRDILNRIVERGTVDTAYRAKAVLSGVYRYILLENKVSYDPTTSLTYFLPDKNSKHYPTMLDPTSIGQLLRTIDEYTGSPMVKTALKISPYLFQRPGEIRQMEWTEINWAKKQWEIPAAKMKMSSDHIVPLATQVIDLLKYMHFITSDSKYVFSQGLPSSKAMSEGGVGAALKAMGYTGDLIVPHSFRSMARTLLDEELNYRVDWIEMQLAHQVKDSNGRAYNRTQFIDSRHEMMQGWADYLDGLKFGRST